MAIALVAASSAAALLPVGPVPDHPVAAPGQSAPTGGASPARAGSGPRYGTYRWPVRGAVVRRFEPPGSAYGPGHRGIDIAAPFGSSVVAAHDGVVAFAGGVAGELFVSVDHPDGVRTTYSWL
ncbi:MAG: peptidoglycan DD-metalloendopeptidase family protein, partial [Actinomycetota bacterium]|nr:peptidoglycan DD-metalloendopeptidase family protein [Actinomycetota bacterium]